MDPVWFVKEREEVPVPLCRERHKFPDGGVWRVEVPNAGEKVSGVRCQRVPGGVGGGRSGLQW